MTVAGVVGRRRENPGVAGFAPFLSLALTHHSTRYPEDSQFIVSVLGLEEFDNALVEAVLDREN